MAEERNALITGANKGIGFETARQLAGRGFRVFIGARDGAKGEQAAARIRQEGGKADPLILDVADSVSVRAAAEKVVARTDHLDVLVNNAGIYPDKGLTILTVSRRQLVDTFETNAFGPVEVVQALLPLLCKARGARVINVSSGLGQLDGLTADIPSYGLSKLALNGMTIMQAQTLRGDGIAVNSVCPGWVRTDMGGANAERSVEQGADTIVWLAAEADGALTGKFFRDRREIPW